MCQERAVMATWARARGHAARALVTGRAAAAAALYRRLGFEPTGEGRPMTGRPQLTESVLVLSLRAPARGELPVEPTE